MGQPSTVIVGGGIAGLATAWGLARAGAGPVTVLEREASLGFWSSGRNAGILRSAIPATATRQLALRSEARYHDLPLELVRHAPGPIFDAVGMVLCEGAPGLPAPLWWEDFEALGAVEAWSPAQLQTRVPYYQPEGTRAWWMPRAGRIQVSNLMTALERACLELGVQFRLGTRVQGLMHDD
ncbi:MAG TPA: FAD-dependent oxidoreductase, partial [Planctomycetota bacterium]|nr:FAD-dependent oxidoreductase [Planctomycetota bacterium]